MYRRALLLALACGVVAVSLFLLYLKRFEAEASGGERVRLLVVLRSLERGEALTDDVLGVREVPQAYVEGRSVREIDKPKVLGLRMGGPLQAQETLLWTDLAVSGEERTDLSALVQTGRRALTIRVRDDSGVALIRPGDYVDVIGVVEQGADSSRAAVVLLQRTLVLAVGSSLSPDAAQEAIASDTRGQLTLSVALPDAQLLAVAAERGELTVALRGAEDNQTAARLPEVSMRSLLALQQARGAGDARPAAAGPTELKVAEQLTP